MTEVNPLEPVSFEATLTESGVSLSTKSRFISALDRMFGGLFAIPAAFLEGRAAKTQLLAQLDRERTDAQAKLQLAGELKIAEIELAAECIAKERDARQLINLASVAQIALEDLRENKPTEETEPDSEISNDWLNWFQDFATKASSDSVRTLWGKILAGEARQPGRFSIGTLRTLAEVDQPTALLFQKHVDHLFWNRYIIKSEELKGKDLLELTALEDAGLLREVNGMKGFDQSFGPDGKIYFEQNDVVLELTAPNGTKFRVSVILLSRAGLELVSILPQPDPSAAFRRIAEVVPKTVQTAKLGPIVSRSGLDSYQWDPVEVLRGKS
jgi:hypothetical protein